MERENINQILDLRFAKKTYEEIAATVGYTTRTIGRVLSSHRADLALMHSQWLELTNEKFHNDLRNQATHRATILHQLREELSTRKFTDIPVDKLMRMIEQGERAMRETENYFARIVQRGNQCTDGYLMEIDEPSFMESLTSFPITPALSPLPKPTRAPAPTPAPTVLPAPATGSAPATAAEPHQPEPLDRIPEDWTPEEEALYQQMLKEEAEDLAQQAKISAMVKTPIPTTKEAMSKQKKAA
jgi:hypothetical protein